MASDTDLLDQIRSAPDLGALDQLRVSVLGKSGSITARLKSLGSMDPDTRAAEAPKIHALREQVTSAISDRKAALESAELNRKLATETIDLSLPAQETPQGTVHPVSQVMDELAEIFADLGFAVAEGPEIEDQWHNFTALNMPEFHPARAMQDTFYLERHEGEAEAKVLRTHTSPVQIRAMQTAGAPLYVIAPGRVYRSDSDATHTPMFHQVEGLVIDRAIHMGHLKWTLETFLKAFFERDDVVLRLRPSFFPFTEPSAEVDISCVSCGGTGCRNCKGTGWIEVMGCGMVHRSLFRNVGYDPERYTGFAFGGGIERYAKLRYNVEDLQLYFQNDMRFLEQF